MPNTPVEPNRAFYDVFISYRHHDSEQIDGLECKIRSAGFEPFRDLNFPDLSDTSNVTRVKIETIRRQLSRSTCLIFAYSHGSAVRDRKADVSLGVWMPWELGFFDGAISSRIGVYLLDGPRSPEQPKEAYYKGSEYLGLYDELSDNNLKAFLDRNAVRERRIDNVAAGFVWLENLFTECVANPANVTLGLTEWFVDHAARFWQEHDNPALADALARFKVMLDDMRVTAAPAWRCRIFDQLEEARQRLLAPTPRAVSPAASYAPEGAPMQRAHLEPIAQQLMTAWNEAVAASIEAAGRKHVFK
jgi:hypothetical protein